jgi:hypothetical protein
LVEKIKFWDQLRGVFPKKLVFLGCGNTDVPKLSVYTHVPKNFVFWERERQGNKIWFKKPNFGKGKGKGKGTKFGNQLLGKGKARESHFEKWRDRVLSIGGGGSAYHGKN